MYTARRTPQGVRHVPLHLVLLLILTPLYTCQNGMDHHVASKQDADRPRDSVDSPNDLLTF